MNNLVIGNGQIGKPLMEILEFRYAVFGRDVEPVLDLPIIDVMHICFPYGEGFAEAVVGYVKEYKPALCIIHSTVEPGVTDHIGQQVDVSMVYSPVRGRHGDMVADLKRYTKFVAGDRLGVETTIELFKSVGMRAKSFPSTKGLELAKLLETTYSGLLIAWAQEMARYCGEVKLDYFDLMPFFAEIDYLPDVAFQPGIIGGHCIMPNLSLLEQMKESSFVEAIKQSNTQMARDSLAHQLRNGERLLPVPMADFK